MLAAMACALLLAAWPGAAAATPAPCGGVAQIDDLVGDGHHDNTDVTSAWFSEASGHLQAVIKVRFAVWEPIHDDSDAASFAMLFSSGGAVRYVRAEAPRLAPVRFDYGTWSLATGFVSAGATTGSTTTGAGGAVTIDVPEAAGAVPGSVLARPFVLTSDGLDGTEPHWVDRAPGGVTPAGDEFGADVVVGSACPVPATPGGSTTPPTPGAPVGTTPAGPPVPGTATTVALALAAPSTLLGSGTARITGSIVPARAGVAVELDIRGTRRTTRRLITDAAGRFSLALRLTETTRVRATAEGIGSQTRTMTVRSTVHISVRRLRGGGAVISGTVSPALPGRVLLLRTTSAVPSARTTARGGRFNFHLHHPVPGRYQAVFIPPARRAERSTSTTGVIR